MTTSLDDKYREIIENIKPHFSESFGGFFIPQGWIFLVDQLNSRLENYDPFYILAQAKEKFGGLRYYIDVDHSIPENASEEEYEEIMNDRWAVYQELQTIVREYEVRSLTTCQGCGDINAYQRDAGWVATLCDSCFAIVERGYE